MVLEALGMSSFKLLSGVLGGSTLWYILSIP